MSQLSVCILPKGTLKRFFSQWKKITLEKIAWQDSCVLAGAAAWVVLIVFSHSINCCLLLSGVTGTTPSTK